MRPQKLPIVNFLVDQKKDTAMTKSLFWKEKNEADNAINEEPMNII